MTSPAIETSQVTPASGDHSESAQPAEIPTATAPKKKKKKQKKKKQEAEDSLPAKEEVNKPADKQPSKKKKGSHKKPPIKAPAIISNGSS